MRKKGSNPVFIVNICCKAPSRFTVCCPNEQRDNGNPRGRTPLYQGQAKCRKERCTQGYKCQATFLKIITGMTYVQPTSWDDSKALFHPWSKNVWNQQGLQTVCRDFLFIVGQHIQLSWYSNRHRLVTSPDFSNPGWLLVRFTAAAQTILPTVLQKQTRSSQQGVKQLANFGGLRGSIPEGYWHAPAKNRGSIYIVWGLTSRQSLRWVEWRLPPNKPRSFGPQSPDPTSLLQKNKKLRLMANEFFANAFFP